MQMIKEKFQIIHIDKLVAGDNIRDFAKVTKIQIEDEIKKSKDPNSVDVVKKIKKNLKQEKETIKNKNENQSDILDLAQNIRKNGLLQPLIVTQNKDDDGTYDDAYTVVAGHRRFFAITNIIPLVLEQEKKENIRNLQGTKKERIQEAEKAFQEQIAKFENITCKVIAGDSDIIEIQIAENMVRTDMTMKEKADVVHKLYKELKIKEPKKGYTAVANRCNVSKEYIAKLVKIAENRYKGNVGKSSGGKLEQSAMTIDEAKIFINNIRSFNEIENFKSSVIDAQQATTTIDEEIVNLERTITLLKKHKKEMLIKKQNEEVEQGQQEEQQEIEETIPNQQEQKSPDEEQLEIKNRGRKPKLVSEFSESVIMQEVDEIVQRTIQEQKVKKLKLDGEALDVTRKILEQSGYQSDKYLKK